MTAKRKKFCEAYVVSGNATTAAIEAGYSPRSARSTASELLDAPDVQEYIKELTAPSDAAQRSLTDRVLSFFEGVMDDSEQPTSVRIKAAENLAKRCGFYDGEPNSGDDDAQEDPALALIEALRERGDCKEELIEFYKFIIQNKEVPYSVRLRATENLIKHTGMDLKDRNGQTDSDPTEIIIIPEDASMPDDDD